MQLVVAADHLRDDLLQKRHNLVRVCDAALFHACAERIADFGRGVHADVRHDKQLFKLLKQLLIDLCERVEHAANLPGDAVSCFF